ncbi:HNH endonuclease [Candidatus Woesearchaeota archaeon]|nr:HNH endonuclease [Candidatus Woesearchaeota archaeon]
MKPLILSFAPPAKWRNEKQTNNLKGEAWQNMRLLILNRDNYTCAYCSFRSEKYQIVDHIDGDPENNSDKNFQIVCQMCNLIKHSGMGCEITGVVDLFKVSKYGQNDIMKITREMRDKDSSDAEIQAHLGLKNKVDFKMDRDYLKSVFGFVTSRKSKEEDDMYNHWLEYHKKQRMIKNASL